MKWLAKHTEANYTHGTTRLSRRFAWLPVYISGKMVWLETFEVLQMYEVITHNAIIEDKPMAFKLFKWVNLSKRIIE